MIDGGNTMRALALLSGGLDSVLAAAMLTDSGVRVESVRFDTGFGREDYIAAVGAEVRTVDVAEEYFERVVVAPRYGYGAAMNPCIDCRIFMLRRADEIARSRGIDLLITGEVIGQDAFAQCRSALVKIESEARLEGRLLRPLCALHMDETEIESRGGIDRMKLGRLHGRSRKGQYEMAERLGIESFPTPSGGCCWLARADFGRRLRDLLSHRGGARPRAGDVELLKRGRHFRVAWNLKVILGRDEDESIWLAARAAGGWSCQVADGRGSFGLIETVGEAAPLELAAGLAARYSSRRDSRMVEVVLRRGVESRTIEIPPAPADLLEKWRI
jgi:hypothetical protein